MYFLAPLFSDKNWYALDNAKRHLVQGILHLVKVSSLVEVAGQQLGQQGLGDVCHAAQDEADEDLHDGGPGNLHILFPLLPISKGHQEQQQRQACSQAPSHRFLQHVQTDSAFAIPVASEKYDMGQTRLQVSVPTYF